MFSVSRPSAGRVVSGVSGSINPECKRAAEKNIKLFSLAGYEAMHSNPSLSPSVLPCGGDNLISRSTARRYVSARSGEIVSNPVDLCL